MQTPHSITLFMLLVVACADGEQLTTHEAESDTTGWTPGGVYEGAIGTDFECSLCSGEDPCSRSCVESNGDRSSCGVAGATCAAVRYNVAASSALATATASSTFSTGTAPATAINGDRRGLSWANGGGWSDATNNQYPDSLQINMSGAKPISQIDIYTLQDACGDSPSATTCVEPTNAMTFSKWGITDFRVETWNGSAFEQQAKVNGNTLVKRTIDLSSPVTTSKLRVVVDNARGLFSRIIEVEAWYDASTLDPSLALAINYRIAMSGATGCEASAHATTINGVTGYYKRCNYAWVVASPGNGAWLLPQSYISDRYLHGTVWPATATATMTAMGFPKGAYHGSDATDSYVVFERGILAKSNAYASARKIGGLPIINPDYAVANAALAKAWLESKLVDKYPDTDTSSFALGDGYGFRFSTEANAGGYDSSFMLRAGTSQVFRIHGEIDNKWASATSAQQIALGFPISDEIRISSNGSAISQFSGGAIVWRPTSCASTTFTAEILLGEKGPVYADRLASMTCEENVQVCFDGPETPFTSPDGVTGTYQYKCGDVYGWWDRMVFHYTDASGPHAYMVRAPILGRYLSESPIVLGAPPISVEEALASGLGRPRMNQFNVGDVSKQLFERGEIIEARSCASTCTEKIACDRSCTDGGARITCGDYTPQGYANGMCQLYDVYCELPEITDARVLDAREGANGPESFLYYYRSGSGSAKRGRMPTQLGGVGGVAASLYRDPIWSFGIPNIQPDRFPFASNFPGRSFVIEDALQLEFTAAFYKQPEIAHPHPVLPAKQCISLPHDHYGAVPQVPVFPASSLHHVLEDDECWGPFCNSDDYIASIRLYHNDCGPQVWSQERDFGFTATRTLTNQSPSSSPDLGGKDNTGSRYMDLAHYRTYCYRGRNMKKGGSRSIDTWEFGIGTALHSGFIEP